MRGLTDRLAVAAGSVCLTLLWSCHDSPRRNPFDPTLTPAVELRAVADDSTGTVTLAWSPYAGVMAFAEYLVLRNVQGFEAVDTLRRIDDARLVSYVDTDVIQDSTYVYRVSVVTADGYEAPSQECVIRPLALPPIEITGHDFRSSSASVALTWTAYRGPRFASYQVWRNDGANTSRVVVLTDSTQTAYVDSHLLGNTRYTYRVTVTTQRDEEVSSPPASGSIHPLVDTWRLPVEGEGTHTDYVRLAAEPGGRVDALIVGSHRVRLLVLDGADGSVVEDQLLLDLPFAVSTRSVASTVGADGMRYVTLGRLVPGIVAFHPDGTPVLREYAPFADLGSAEDQVPLAGEVALVSPLAESGAFRDVRVYADGEAVLADDFHGLPDDWFEDTALEGWAFSGMFRRQGAWLQGSGATRSVAARADPGWHDVRFEADVVTGDNAEGEAGIQLGSAAGVRVYLGLNAQRQQVVLQRLSPRTGGDRDDVETQTAPFRVVDRAPYRLSLESVNGAVRARVHSSVHFAQTFEGLGLADRRSFVWASLAAVHAGLGLTIDELSFTVDGTGTGERHWTEWEEHDQRVVSSLRTWWTPDADSLMMSVSLPDDDRIRVGRVFYTNPGSWACCFREWGPRFGPRTHNLFYPLTAQGGPDGRVFVLDPGNQRVLVLRDRQYVTELGGYGSAPGEFDFGDETGIEKGRSFSGSLCLDEAGYLYVADVFNRRIQKFAP